MADLTAAGMTGSELGAVLRAATANGRLHTLILSRNAAAFATPGLCEQHLLAFLETAPPAFVLDLRGRDLAGVGAVGR